MKQMSRMQRKMSLTFFGKSSACCSAASQIFGCLAVQLDQTGAEVDDLILDCVSMEVWWLNQVSIDGKNCWGFLPGRHHNTTTILREGSSFRLPFRLWTKHLPISVNFCLLPGLTIFHNLVTQARNAQFSCIIEFVAISVRWPRQLTSLRLSHQTPGWSQNTLTTLCCPQLSFMMLIRVQDAFSSPLDAYFTNLFDDSSIGQLQPISHSIATLQGK